MTGKVTLDGNPMTSGTISFITEDGKEAFTGQIDGTGNYKLGASPTDPGALPGEYKVIVMAPEKTKTPDEAKAMMEAKTAAPGSAAPSAPKSLVPEKYNKKETSGLTGSVKAGSNTINFELKSS